MVVGLAGILRDAHFSVGVSLRNQPRADVGRDLSYAARHQTVELDAIDFTLMRRVPDSNFHWYGRGCSATPLRCCC
jgi:hypothetical protein